MQIKDSKEMTTNTEIHEYNYKLRDSAATKPNKTEMHEYN